jgi:hypothetical protein
MRIGPAREPSAAIDTWRSRAGNRVRSIGAPVPMVVTTFALDPPMS